MSVNIRSVARGLLLALALYGCTSSAVGQQPINSVNLRQDTKLQFVVGWATGYDLNPQGTVGSSYGLNFVETFRQQDGHSAVLTDQPEIDLHPGIVPNITTGIGGDGGEVNQLVKSLGGPAYGSGFGVPPPLSGALTSLLAVNQGVGGPPSFFPQPLNYTTLTQSFLEGFRIVYPIPILGRPPTQDSVPLALAQAELPGPFTLHVTISTSTGSIVLTQAQTLKGSPLARMGVPSVAFDGNGGGVFTVAIPAGVSETMINIQTSSCIPAGSGSPSPSPAPTSTPVSGPTPPPGGAIPYYYTLLSKTPGPATLSIPLPDLIGPTVNGITYHSICTAADLGPSGGHVNAQFYAAGFNYPAYESVYPQNTSETPVISGADGQADMTVSPVITAVAP